MANRKISKITAIHYVKLIYRLGVFIAAVIVYIQNHLEFERFNLAAFIIWLLFMVEMLCRLFPSDLESMGCQKQFARNYIPKNNDDNISQPYFGKGILLTAVLWIILNLAIGMVYMAGVIDEGALILISLAYAVCDMICVLFFCPFQRWLLRHRCCVTCRMYNWDYIMMFTPLVFINNIFAWATVLLAAVVLIQWEVKLYTRRERFYEETNAALTCKCCKEKNCKGKFYINLR